ncbi:B3 domain-containing protein-like [Iris pallida]|uniref:B3 domain-containing protein-like n=1 Tax=Iris pallida TaxID=29817 RepID=A0AAX6DHJ3_IRIPA|nr:B3 domain-containing protein-like [Iris pallida]
MKEEKEFAEQYYWNHMARLNFITIMAQGFYQEMVLPEKIVKCSREELSENVILKGPSGNLWRVKLLKVEGDLLFKDGWKEFVEAHSIEEGDILSFAYEGYSCFNVLIYDKGDYCEKETSYFARNHKNVLADGACPPKKQSPGDSADMLKPPPADTSEVQSPKVNYDDNPHVEQLSPPGCTASNGHVASSALRVELGGRRRKVRKIEFADHPMGPAEDMHKHLTLDKLEAQAQNLSPVNFPASGRRTGSKSHCSACTGRENKIRKGDSTSKGKGGRPRKLAVGSTEPKLIKSSKSSRRRKLAYEARIETILKSSRRPVTNEEKERTLQIAGEIKPANPFFRTVMRDSHVYRGHFMTIPADFVATHRLLKWRRADLRVPDRKDMADGKDMWHDVRIQPKASSGLTGAEWRNFVQDNNLEEGDVCIFELCEAGKNLVFDVHIFRVVNEVTPLIKETATF